MERQTLETLDVIVVPLTVLVLFYHLLVVQRPIEGVLLAVWILGVHASLRLWGRDHALVAGGLGLFVLAGYYSGSRMLYFTNLVLAGFAYTIWTLKHDRIQHLTS